MFEIDDFASFYDWIIHPLVWACVLLIWLLSHLKEKQKQADREREHRERIERYDREWAEQLRNAPWLRDVMAAHARYESQISLTLGRQGGEFIIIDAHVLDGDEVIILDELILAEPPHERVNWKQEGF